MNTMDVVAHIFSGGMARAEALAQKAMEAPLAMGPNGPARTIPIGWVVLSSAGGWDVRITDRPLPEALLESLPRAVWLSASMCFGPIMGPGDIGRALNFWRASGGRGNLVPLDALLPQSVVEAVASCLLQHKKQLEGMKADPPEELPFPAAL